MAAQSSKDGNEAPSLPIAKRAKCAAVIATAIAPVTAFGSLCVIRVAALTYWPSLSTSSAKKIPAAATRIAGPLPAENTPLRSGDTPNHNLTIDFNVAIPIPAGSPNSHQRKLPANSFRNAATSRGCFINARPSKTECSVSSETIPYLNRNPCFHRPFHRLRTVPADKFSDGNPKLSPTAVPTKHP